MMPSPLWYVCSSPYRWHVQDLDKLPCRYTVVTLHPNCYGPRNIPHKVIVSLASTNQVLESKCVSIYSIIYHHISVHIYPYIYIYVYIYICIHNIYPIYISLNPHMFFFVQWGVVAFFFGLPIPGASSSKAMSEEGTLDKARLDLGIRLVIFGTEKPMGIFMG